MNAEELAEVAAFLEERSEQGWVAQVRTWLRRVRDWLKRLLAGVLAATVVCVAGGLGLARLGVNGHLAIRGLVLASPVMAATLLVFLARAWGQNFTAPPLARDVTDAAPASQDHLASQPAATPADVASQPTVTVTVLPAAGYVPRIRLHSTPEQIVADYAARHPAIASGWKDPDGDD